MRSHTMRGAWNAAALVAGCLMLMLAIVSVQADYEHPAERADDPKILSRDVKCQVCRATIVEMLRAISKEDPRKKVEVSGFRMDSKDLKTVQLIRSETYLTELMETVCKSMDDYAKARMKDTRKLIVLKMMTEQGTMNSMMSAVDFVYDGDLNKSLEHFCLEVLEDHEDTFLDAFMRDKVPENVQHLVCTEAANYCDVEEDEIASDNKEEL